MHRNSLYLAWASILLCPLLLQGNALQPPFLFSGGGACVGNAPLPLTCDGSLVDLFNVGALSGSFGSAADGVTMSMSASGTASYGVLKVGASATFSVTKPDKGADADADARFQDVMTVNFAPFTGEPGLMLLQYNLDGTNASTGIGEANLDVTTAVSGPGIKSQSWIQGYSSPSVNGVFSPPSLIEFIYGQPFDLIVDLLGTASGFEVGTGTANSDFSDTFVLSGLIPMDASGNPVVGATFTSGSGTVYTENGVVPEPSLRWAMFGLLVAMIGLGRSRRLCVRP